MTELIRARSEVTSITLIGEPLAAACRLVRNVNTMEGQVWSSVMMKA
ncbi:hypothetical protein H8B09_04435 [Paenibacillus sp. PR3]|uniref:Uncharacterized protein n=1 Tax=Paenibacillus terricola TaxID=2763503 RepID=A0ABR8MSI5_9BACL|nr:hypothetical protein [Paenibacillus terricola]MBD3917991.1 hypothetical protein [Paenibacillus terricola]